MSQRSPSSGKRWRPYHADPKRWYAIRMQVLARDNHRCRACGLCVWPLDVHHVVPCETDPSESNLWDIDGLVSLCKSCHSKADNAPDEIAGQAEWGEYVKSLDQF